MVESKGFKDKTFLNATGAPHDDSMRTVEHIDRITPYQGEDVLMVHDPGAQFVYRLRNGIQVEDYVCVAKRRDISLVRGVPGD